MKVGFEGGWGKSIEQVLLQQQVLCGVLHALGQYVCGAWLAVPVGFLDSLEGGAA